VVAELAEMVDQVVRQTILVVKVLDQKETLVFLQTLEVLTLVGINMARKSALEKIEYHEKICRLMQKQTFEQIQQLKNQIIRIERILIGTAAFVIISLLEKVI
jgi:hypothetical protein